MTRQFALRLTIFWAALGIATLITGQILTALGHGTGGITTALGTGFTLAATYHLGWYRGHQHRYERATSRAANDHPLWLHSCGVVSAFTLAPEPDPNNTDRPWRWCDDVNCRDQGPWTPLYREARQP